MKSDENKIKALGPHLAMAFGGEPGDTNKFADWVERNLRLFHIRSVFFLFSCIAKLMVQKSHCPLTTFSIRMDPSFSR